MMDRPLTNFRSVSVWGVFLVLRVARYKGLHWQFLNIASSYPEQAKKATKDGQLLFETITLSLGC